MGNTHSMKTKEAQQAGAAAGPDRDKISSQPFRHGLEGTLGYAMDLHADLTADEYWESRLAFLETPLRRSILILNVKG